MKKPQEILSLGVSYLESTWLRVLASFRFQAEFLGQHRIAKEIDGSRNPFHGRSTGQKIFSPHEGSLNRERLAIVADDSTIGIENAPLRIGTFEDSGVIDFVVIHFVLLVD